METTNIRIEVDSSTYSTLKEEQLNHKLETKRTISLANIILHYFYEGINNATEEGSNGLRTISTHNSLGDLENKNSFINDKAYFNDIASNIEKIATKLNEHDYTSHNKLVEIFNLISRNNEPNIYQLDIKNKLNELNYQISNIKPILSTNSSSLSNLKRILNNIDKQTHKSSIEKILPYATPILQIISFLLLNKNIKSNSNDKTNAVNQIKLIIEKLPDQEKELITQIIDQNLNDIL